MRRKLFFCAVILLGAVFLVLEISPDLFVPGEAAADGQVCEHRGKVLSIKEKDDSHILVLMDERGFRVRLTCYDDIEEPWTLIGRVMEYSSVLTPGDPARNPYGFDYRKYLRSEGVFLQGRLRGYSLIPGKAAFPDRVKACLFRLRHAFSDLVPEESRGILQGMLFGDTGSLDEETYEEFRRNGTAHVLAVSGLHIGLIYSLMERISGGKKGPLSLSVMAAVLLGYGTLSMWRPSVIRAEIMAGLKTAAKYLRLRYDSTTAMSLAAIILILRNPYVVWGAGFQMSFLAILSINTLVPHMPEKVPDSIAQTLAVSLALMLYQARTFNYLSPLSFLINIPIIYLAGIAIPASLLTFILYGIFFAAGAVRMFPGSALVPALSVMDLTVRLNEMLSFGGIFSFDVISPPVYMAVFITVLVFFGLSEYAEILKLRKRKETLGKILIIIAFASVLSGVLLREPVARDQVIFVDVGQGACTHIREGSTDVLIDGGGSSTVNKGRDVLKPYLLKTGSRDCDLALATHEDMDHIKGLEELCDCFRVGRFVQGSEAGDRYVLGDKVYIETLWPLDAGDEPQENGNSSVFMINYQGVRILVTGDLDIPGEEEMIAHYRRLGQEGKLRADVLNVGHHGSATSTGDELLDTVKPEVAVIQVGRNNYGHPSEEVLDRLRNRGISVLRNDLSGAVGLRISGGKIEEIHLMIAP